MKNCPCCFISPKDRASCEALAVVEIRDVPETPMGYTHACGDHVDALTSDGRHTFHRFRIPGDSETISDAPSR